MRIDLNADVGEGVGDDAALLRFVSSANVCCGGHAGDAETMQRTIRAAADLGVAVGGHPGYPDREGFGRREMAMEPAELEASIRDQLQALAGIAQAEGVELRHVKPHGALYNRAARDPALADVVARAVRAFSADVTLFGLAGSALLDAGRAVGLAVASEAFADRAYEADGSLRARTLPGALLDDPAEAAAQARSIACDRKVTAFDGTTIDVLADTICLHGDTPGAPTFAGAVREALERAGVEIRPVATSS